MASCSLPRSASALRRMSVADCRTLFARFSEADLPRSCSSTPGHDHGTRSLTRAAWQARSATRPSTPLPSRQEGAPAPAQRGHGGRRPAPAGRCSAAGGLRRLRLLGHVGPPQGLQQHGRDTRGQLASQPATGQRGGPPGGGRGSRRCACPPACLPACAHALPTSPCSLLRRCKQAPRGGRAGAGSWLLTDSLSRVCTYRRMASMAAMFPSWLHACHLADSTTCTHKTAGDRALGTRSGLGSDASCRPRPPRAPRPAPTAPARGACAAGRC